MAWLALTIVIAALVIKIAVDQRAVDDIRAQMSDRLRSDTNTLISVSSGDRHIRRLAADLNTQLRLLRDERRRLENGDRELKEAVASISHDLRTPLTAICGYMEMLDKEALPARAGEYLGIISGRIDALRVLTEELFQYSVVSTAQTYSARETVCLNEEIEACVAAYYGALRGKGIAPEITLPGDRVVRSLNRAALHRILGNMMTNAIQYSGGDLSIVLTEEGGIAFSNHALGLDDVTVGRLFDRFYTVENARGGAGLGLYIARSLTKQLGGTIGAFMEDGRFTIRVCFPGR